MRWRPPPGEVRGGLRGRVDCLAPIRWRWRGSSPDRARYEPGGALVTVRVPGTAPNLDGVPRSRVRAPLGARCPSNAGSGPRFLEAAGLPRDAPGSLRPLRGPPSERFAEAVVALVLGGSSSPRPRRIRGDRVVRRGRPPVDSRIPESSFTCSSFGISSAHASRDATWAPAAFANLIVAGTLPAVQESVAQRPPRRHRRLRGRTRRRPEPGRIVRCLRPRRRARRPVRASPRRGRGPTLE